MAEHIKNTKTHDELIVKLINIQGLSQTKTTEIENEMNDDTIFCITETQHKYQRTHFQENTHKICSWRDEDKKGGGLMVLHKEGRHIQCKKEDSDHSDVLYVRCKFQNTEIVIILVYMSTNDKTRNKCIQQKVESILRKEEQGSLLLLGDFVGHLGFLGPQQCDENGKMYSVGWMIGT